jgi:predicted exporter
MARRRPGEPGAGCVMKGRHKGILFIWAGLALIALWVIARARYSADLSAFLPRAPTAAQRLLVEQLRQGVASKLIVAAVQGADEPTRARLAQE